ncbi:Ger(x)C family spore germination C-terminal domain-containing protein [Bacillus cereus]
MGKSPIQLDGYITVNMRGDIQEVSGNLNLQKRGERHKQIQRIENHLNTEAAQLMLKLKKEKVDPLGIGAKFKRKYSDFDIKEWRDMYDDVPIHVAYHLNIYNSGVIE